MTLIWKWFKKDQRGGIGLAESETFVISAPAEPNPPSKRARVISVSNFNLTDTSIGVMSLIQALPQSTKTLVIEMPCLSIPRLAVTVVPNKELSKLDADQSMDRLVLDMDRNQLKSLSEYMYTSELADYILLNPQALLDQSLIKQLQDANTLINLRAWIVEQARVDYDIIMLVTQGKLDMPTTFFSIEQADTNVFMIHDSSDIVLNQLAIERLKQDYHFASERFVLFASNRSVQSVTKETLIVSPKRLWKTVYDIPLLDDEATSPPIASDESHFGYIQPVNLIRKEGQDRERSVSSKHSLKPIRDLKKWNDIKDQIQQQLQEKHLDDFVASLMDGEARERVRFYIADLLRSFPVGSLPGGLEEVTQFVQREITELGVLQKLLDDPQVINIEINGPKQVIIERAGQVMQATDVEFEDVDHLYRIINRMLSFMGKQLTSNEPVIDTTYHGTRVCAVADRERRSGLSMGSPLASIRKFPPRVLSDEEVIASGNASQEIVDFLNFAVPAGANIVAVGATNSGKTSTLIRFPLYVDPLTRIISIEDSPEVLLSSKEQYRHYPNLISLLTKILEDVTKSYPIHRLTRTCMRLNPWGFLIGETREEEAALEMLKAANTGHVMWTTTHANGCEEGAMRILQLCGNTSAIAAQISQSLDIFIFLKRLPNGRRVIMRIAELVRYEGVEKPIMNVIFAYDLQQERHIQVGYLQTNRMRDKINSHTQYSEAEIKQWCRFEQESFSYQEVKRSL